MPTKEQIIFQPYLWRKPKKGAERLEGAPPIACRTKDEALRRAEKVERGETSFAGAHVVRMIVDEDAGDYSEPEFLASVGEVPKTDEF